MSDEYTGPEHLLVPGTLRGYRAWRLDGSFLRSVVDAGVWQETGNTADCGRFDSRLMIIGPEVLDYHRTPDRHCTCGFYAKHHLSAVEGEFNLRQFLHGSIKAYGKVILGTKGFRAQYADIEALCTPSRHSTCDCCPNLETALACQYPNIPIYHDREAFLNDFPPIPVDHLLPPEPDTTERNPPAMVKVVTLTPEQVAGIWKALGSVGIDPAKEIEEEQSE